LKILFVANRFPYPPFRGDKLKIYNLARLLSEHHELHLATFVQNRRELRHMDALRKYFKTVNVVYLPKALSVLKCLLNLFSGKPYQIIYFRSKRMHTLIGRLLRDIDIDVIHTQHLRMAQYTAFVASHPRILDLPDAYSLYWARRSKLSGNPIMKWFNQFEYGKVVRYEEIISKFDLNLVCSVEDQEFLAAEHGCTNIRVLPNGVDLDGFKSHRHDYSINNKIIFTGNMDYFPNIDAAVFFVRKLLPAIREKHPNVQVFIAGQRPVKKVRALASTNVHVTGFVEDLARLYNDCALAVSPIRYGAGTLNKVLEPMALGVPVVSSEVGFRGLGISSGEGAILAESKERFVEAVCSLLDNPSLRMRVGTRGRQIVFERFGWKVVAALLDRYFGETSGTVGQPTVAVSRTE
jgi:sugar transferase (PEP-CTERM/EpsH1 system associated)